MPVLGIDLASTSRDPGWAPASGAPHDALWQNSATSFTVRPATGGATSANTTGLFDSTAGSIDITSVRFANGGSVNGATAGASAVSLDWSADGQSATLTLDRAWNTIKNAEVYTFTGTSLTLANWVDAWVHLDNDFGQTIVIDGAKRGEVATGSGNDTIRVGVDSNGAGWTNHFRIDSGAGDDVIEITVASKDYSITSFAPAYNAAWTTTEVFAGAGNDSAKGGGGADAAWLGDGDDRFEGRGGNDSADGGAGLDTAGFSGNQSDYAVTVNATMVVVRDLRQGPNDGTDTLVDFEHLVFADGERWLIELNQPPMAVGEVYVFDEDMVLTVGAATGVLANDSDPNGDPLSALLVTGPQHGTLTLNADGSLIYQPVANWNGIDSFTYRASDGTMTSDPVTVTLLVEAVNDAPLATADSYQADENVPLRIAATAGVLANDADPEGFDLQAVLQTGPAHGTLTLSADGGFTYTPDAGFYGTDSFSYRAIDTDGAEAIGTVTLTVAPEIAPPVGAADQYGALEDEVLVITAAQGVLANDTQEAGLPMTVRLVSGPTSGGALNLAADGGFSYRGDTNWHGTDSFTYVAVTQGRESGPITVTLAVATVNDAPVARNDALTTTEDMPLAISQATLLGNDTDVDGGVLAVLEIARGPDHGQLAQNADGSFTYTPNANYVGSDSFTYRATDGAATATATVTLTIAGADDPVTAIADAYQGFEDTTLSFNADNGLLANDLVPDGGGQIVAGTFATAQGGSVTIQADGSFSYQGAADFFGTDSFEYTLGDADGDTAIGTATVTLADLGEGPPAEGLAALAAEGGAVRLLGAGSADAAGGAVAAGRDVNGDGIADMVVGAVGMDTTGRANSGGAYVVFGAETMAGDVSLGNLGTGGFRVIGARGSDQAGISVALLDDMTGDGLAEIAIGASQYDVSGVPNAGGVFVVFGKANTTQVDLSQIASGIGGFLVRGAATTDQAGFSVSNAGDVNGDDLGDLVMGANLSNAGGFDSGAAYVVFGKANTAQVNVGLVSFGGFAIRGAAVNDQAGFGVVGIGDLNGDGMDDIAVGSPGSDAGGSDAGSVSVIFGKETTGAVSLNSLGTSGYRITGADSSDAAGWSVSRAGDVNGDGLDDLILGAPNADPEDLVSGAAYVVYGQAGTGAIQLGTLGTQGFRISGEAEGDRAGVSVAGGSDLNGDGIADLVIGASASSAGAPGAGATYILFGTAGPQADVALAQLTSGAVRLEGPLANDAAGASVALAGDINGDGIGDLLIGVPGADLSGSNMGAAYLVFGQADWLLP
jgi:VCBS repeat-containing protein